MADGNLKVFVRIKPENASKRYKSALESVSPTHISMKEGKSSNRTKSYTFNKVFGPTSAQLEVYQAVVQPLVYEVLQGYNCTVFAYGQTGSGKTFTMEGEHTKGYDLSWENDPLCGIIPRALSQLFEELRALSSEFAVSVSFLELYNEDLYDLLSSTNDNSKLKMYEDPTKKGAVLISGMEEITVTSKSDVYAVLEKGSLKRQTASTMLNARSSRSHTVFTVNVHVRGEGEDGDEVLQTGKLNLVDLAGSENIGRSGAINKHAREAGNINQSLLTLGRVITALVDNCPHVPYRESKLTRLLQESLGGCTKTSIIATISQKVENLEETMSTLDYAHRAKDIKNKPVINQRVCKKTVMKEYSEELKRLQLDYEAAQLRAGVYLEHAENEEMLQMLEKSALEVIDLQENILTVMEEHDRKVVLFEELRSKVEVVDNELKDVEISSKQQKNELANLKGRVVATTGELWEQDYVLLHRMETAEALQQKMHDLQGCAVEEDDKLRRLHNKLDCFRTVNQSNEQLLKESDKKAHETLSSIEEHVENYVHESTNSIEHAVEMLTRNCELYLKKHRDLSQHSESSFGRLSDEVLETTQCLPNKFDGKLNLIDEISQRMKTSGDKSMEDALAFHEMIQNEIQRLVLFSTNLAINDESYCELGNTHFNNLSRAVTSDLEELNQKQQMLSVNFDAQSSSTTAIVNQIIQEGHEFAKLQTSYSKAVEEQLDEALKILNNVMNMIETNDEKVEDYEKTMSHLFNEAQSNCNSKVEFCREFVSEHEAYLSSMGEKWNSLCNNINQHFQDIVKDENFTDTQEIQSIIDVHVPKLKTNLAALYEDFQKAREDAMEKLSSISSEETNLVENISERRKLVSKSVEELNEACKEAIDKFAEEFSESMRLLSIRPEESLAPVIGVVNESVEFMTHLATSGLQELASTGNTPRRSTLQVQSDLPATSPHNRIVQRFREKFAKDFRKHFGCGSVSSDSDLDSTLDSSNVNKENPSTESDSDNCQETLRTPKLRKPFFPVN